MQEDIQKANRSIDEKKREIAVEEAKLQYDKQAEQEERRRRLDATRASIRSAEERNARMLDEIRTLEAQRNTFGAQLNEAKAQAESSWGEMQHCNRQLEGLTQQSFNRINAFGNNLPQVRSRIDQMQWYGQKPVGPLGLFVNLRDSSDQQWAEVMRIALGRLMPSFAVTDPRDRQPLHDLLMQFNK